MMPLLDDGSSQTLDEQIRPHLRMIANTAGGLLPSMAVQLQNTFHANILSSYVITECMPISSPPATYNFEKPGTSSVAVEPKIAILNTSTVKALPTGDKDRTYVHCESCYCGYGQIAKDPSQTVDETFLKDGWFNTGGLGLSR
jgi:long-subunit acyl-CoA synthetase (AMP-forming)